MGKFSRRCSKSSCCKKQNIKEERSVSFMEGNSYQYVNENNKNILGLLSSQRLKDQYEMPISELICYEPIPTCAEKLTGLTLLLAKSFVTGNKLEDYKEYKELLTRRNEGWPNNVQLNYMTGMEAIERYIESLNYDTSLSYCLNFIMQKIEKLSSTYIYEVKWSMPTKEQPVQLATASMYFCLKSFIGVDNTCPIDVSFVYDFTHQVLRPGEAKFRDGWLLDIIRSKEEFFKKYDFKVENKVTYR